MYNRMKFFLAVLIGISVSAQTTINLRGKVSNKAGNPIANAIITLVRQGLKDTTGADGAYLILNGTPVVSPLLLIPLNEVIVLERGFLQFSLPNPSPVTIEIFDVKGTLLKKESLKNVPTGFYRFNVEENFHASKFLIIRTSIGRDEYTFHYLKVHNGAYAVNQSNAISVTAGGKLSAVAAIDDTLITTAANYTRKVMAISSYDQELNISLDSAGGSTGSIGCGKALSDLKSGTHTITSAGLSREYIIDIPAGYDPEKPYRLIFGMHWFGGSMQQVANEKFFSLKPLADNDKIPCIWVAPNGTGSTRGWDLGEKDHAFFDDMYKLFTEKLCVDTKRVFCCGFSFGALFTYSLSLSHQKQLRAVACYSPANWNIYLPPNTHEPIAFYATTGTNEPNTKFIKDEAQRLGVKYCVLDHAADNGCDTNITIPQATSATHASTEFKGCDEYPVKFGSFQGQLSYVEKDPGSSVNWIAAETWEFFMRF